MLNINRWTVIQKLLAVFLGFGAIVGVFGAVALYASYDLAARGDSIGAKLAPLADAAMEIKLNATTGHLYFEEIMAGDAGEDIAAFWGYLDAAQFYTDAIAKGGSNDEGTFIPTDDPQILASLAEVQSALDAFHAAAEERYALLGKDAGAGSSADEAFDGSFDTLMQTADEVEEALHDAMEQGLVALSDARTFAMISLIIAGVGAFAGCSVVLLFFITVVSSRLKTLVGISKALAAGDTSVAVPAQKVHDELTVMFDSFAGFRTALSEKAAFEEADRARGADSLLRQQASDRLAADLSATVDAVMDGDLARRVDERYQQADLSSLAGQVNALIAAMDSGLSETDRVLAALANADLTQRMSGSFRGAFADLRDNTNAVADKLSDVMHELRSTSRALRTATGEILAGANDLSERTTRQAATVEQTSATVEQLAATVGQNASRAQEANNAATAAARIAIESGTAMESATSAMERISAASSKISNIIGLIDDVAFQTNLLALNASVEAARAGEAGKGFAVVAIEVRRLAQSAAEASLEIKKLIELSVGEVQSGTDIVMSVADRVGALNASVTESGKLIGEIAAASRNQAAAIAEVSVAVRQMDEITQHNAALVEETNAAIEQTESQASELDRIVAGFTLTETSRARRAA
ncbi:methyl-accepting chemotaxis protein [Devosia sp. FKR38]|uniref:methyl-accepting chemotaxis protein n=1 Tax=Devosia sp. FKR38 TaxID=2562312 RepID=UPI0010C078A3|nr:methyl-accepting chemotaxis protein [Devosia sp. FKR38]